MLDCIIRWCDTDEDELLNYQEFSDTVKHTSIAVRDRPADPSFSRSIRASSPLRNASPLWEAWATYSPVRPVYYSSPKKSPTRVSPNRSFAYRSSPQRIQS